MPAYTLVVEDRFGSMTEEYVFESGKLLIGRSRECDIVLPSENVSRQHARVYTDSGRLFIEDLGSSNGIQLNGNRLAEATELTEQSVVRLGDFHLHIKGARSSGSERVVHARLVGQNLSAKDDVFELTKTTTLVGRGKDCGITLVDPSVSRIHGRVMVKPDGNVLVEDVGSANGIFVNDQRAKIWQLTEGDLLRFGNVEFLVEIPSADTIQTRVGGPSVLGRILHAARSNLPWTVAIGCALMVIVLLAFFLPDYMQRRWSQAASGTEQPVEIITGPPPIIEQLAPPPQIDPAPLLASARHLLEQRQIDQAADSVAKALAASPTDPHVVELSNRITLERESEKFLALAMEAVTKSDFEAAARALLQVSGDSIFREQCVAQLQELRAPVEKQRKRTCRRKGRKSVDCIRLTALLNKIGSNVE